MRKLVVSVWISLCVLAFTHGQAYAQQTPKAMLEQVSQDMLAGLKAKRAELKNDKMLVYKLVHRILLPHADMQTMSKIVLGRSVWGRATTAQKTEFKRQFTTMLIRTYSSALSSYTDETIRFLPDRANKVTAKRALIRSQIVRRGAQPIDLSYRALFDGKQWLVYDLSVEGVSLVDSMRSQFSDQISTGGIDGLLKSMAEHNKDYL